MLIWEQLIEMRINQHKSEIKQMSPRVWNIKEFELEKWVSSEWKEIEKEKLHYEKTKKKTEQLISQIVKSANKIKQ